MDNNQDLVTKKLELYQNVEQTNPGDVLLTKGPENKILNADMAKCMVASDWIAKEYGLEQLAETVNNIESRYMDVDQKSINNYLVVNRAVNAAPTVEEERKKKLGLF